MLLKFLGYRVENTSFKSNDIKKGTVVSLNPNLQMDIKKDPKNLFLTITVSLQSTEEKPLPFDLLVRIKGSFEIVEDTLDINKMRIESSRVLFPYIRSYVTTFTALNGIPPYVLPIIDFETAPVGVAQQPKTSPAPKKSGIDGIKITPIDDI